MQKVIPELWNCWNSQIQSTLEEMGNVGTFHPDTGLETGKKDGYQIVRKFGDRRECKSIFQWERENKERQKKKKQIIR